MGTLSYLAPEQVEGKKADARTDIFAFGVILYEMATERDPSQGRAGPVSSAPSSRMSRHPSPSSPDGSSRPRPAHRQCLEKDPSERWHSVHHLTKELKWIREGANGAVTSGPTRVGPSKRAWLIAGILAAIALALSSFVVWRGESALGPLRGGRSLKAGGPCGSSYSLSRTSAPRKTPTSRRA